MLNVITRVQKRGEQVQLWPYDCMGKTVFVAIYAKTFLSPLKFEADGFLILNGKGELVEDAKFCQNTIRDFHIWARLYFYPVVKHIVLRKQIFSKKKQMLQIALEDCQKRYERNEYETDDPAKKAYYQTLKELDFDVIENHVLLIRNLETLERIIGIQKSIWQRCSCEKIEKLRQALVKYQPLSVELANYTARRGEIFYRYERAIKEAYHIDLQISRYSILSKLSLSFLLWLANASLYSLAIPFLPEVLKLLYQRLAGYKSLMRASKSHLEEAKKIASFLELFDVSIDYSKIRNFVAREE